MERFIHFAIERNRAVFAILIALLIGGITSYITLPREADPDIPIPIIYAGVVLPGISPADSERLLVKPMELELQGLTGIKEMRSIAGQNYGSVILEFDVSFDKAQALTDVREKIDKVRSEFPEDAEEPDVKEFNTSLFPIIMVNLTSEGSERELYAHARSLKDALSTMPQVLEANLVGHREEVLEIIIDPRAMENYNITAQELSQVLSLNNRLVPAGNIDSGTGRFSISVPGLVETQDDLSNIILKKKGDSLVRLSDIADIRRSFKDPDTLARFNGKPTIAIEVIKRLGANVIETTRAVRTVTANFTENWSDSIEVHISSDISRFIFEMIGALEISITNAILLVIMLVIAALGLRSALLVGFSIPTSFFIGFLVISLLGLTLNQMIMFGLVLSVGILVDGAIVIIEYADRKMAEGLSRKDAYAKAAGRMFLPVLSSTATTLAAFAPMLLWPGVSGKFMSFLPITVIIVLSASLLTAMVFLPLCGGLIGKSEQQGDPLLSSLAADSVLDVNKTPGMTGYYLRFLRNAIAHPFITIGTAVAILWVVISLYGQYGRGVEFFTPVEPDQANVYVKARGNLSISEADRLTRQVEQIVLDTPGIEAAFTRTGPSLAGGSNVGNRGSGNLPPDLVGQITIEFSDFRGRPPASEIIRNIIAEAKHISGIAVEIVARENGPPTGKGIEIEVAGQDLDDIYEVVSNIRAWMDSRPDLLTDMEDSRSLPGIEWNLSVDREAAGRFNTDITMIGSMVQFVTSGLLVGHYRPDDSDDEIEIRARFPAEWRSFDQLDRLRISTPQGTAVPITNFVTRTAKVEVDSIARVDGARVIEVKSNTVIDPVTNLEIIAAVAEQEFTTWFATQEVPNGVRVRLRGANEEAANATAFLGKAMMASLALMFIILLMQFNSLYATFLTLSTVILSTIGVLLGMVITGQTFSVIMTGTGVVALAGIVVNNSIVLIDTYQRLILTEKDRVIAILKTAGQRLRPILLTTITTMIGLFPMAVQTSVDVFNRTIQVGEPNSAWWVQLATAIIFGLGFSTMLTLILVPVMLALPYHLRGISRLDYIMNVGERIGGSITSLTSGVRERIKNQTAMRR
ncbi:MAG: efflux RND transporter permease subunit [Alphaproteobacteria bacterium]|nr:efflux RND transporter permease subunit [Alphaproteobacteria bacterium]MBE8220000.1 efflux RND transporter permease subunit [Alphaproteobacteria bacterium]